MHRYIKIADKTSTRKKEIKPKKRKLTKTVSVGTCKALLVTSLTHVSGGIMSSFLTLPSTKQTQDYFVKSLLSLLNIVFTKRLVLSTTSDGLTGMDWQHVWHYELNFLGYPTVMSEICIFFAGFSSTKGVRLRSRKKRVMGLPDGENRMILWSFVLTQYQRVTDRRTHRSSLLCALHGYAMLPRKKKLLRVICGRRIVLTTWSKRDSTFVTSQAPVSVDATRCSLRTQSPSSPRMLTYITVWRCCRQILIIITITRRWHVTILCQPDGRPPQPVRPWKSGRVHLAEGSNVVVLELPYSTEFGRGRAAH